MLLALLLAAAPAPTATAVPEVRQAAPVSAAPRTLADVARERKGREKPSGGFSASDSTSRPDDGAPVLGTAAATSGPAPAAKALTVRDGEPYWRARAKDANAALRAAEQELHDVGSGIPGVVFFGRPTAAQAVIAAQRENTLAPYRARVTEAHRGITRLRAECEAAKRAGDLCDYNWLR